MALRDLPSDVEEMKEKLFQLDDIVTCGHRCKGHSDCKEGFIVQDYGERIDNIRVRNDGLYTILR
ncbi:hypothetical protein H5410_064207 [Solanum commersonii]|uniref:Uncharacterized protein n=1 Tax=Solanum commersonii TaxID=4109 RepID=A0A9J5W084_SOLCO|nr:hypothetical protein H5410_064207 [Solanum commersonii]